MCCCVLQCVALIHARHRRCVIHTSQRIAVCFSALQCVAVCCSALQCVAVCCGVLHCVAVCCCWADACLSSQVCHLHITLYCSVFECVAVCCSALRCVAVWFSALRCVAVYCGVLQCVGVIHVRHRRCVVHTSQRIAVRLSVSQCVAVRCSVWQCVTVCCSVLQCIAACWADICLSSQRSRTWSSHFLSASSAYLRLSLRYLRVLQHAAVCCSALQCRVVHSYVLYT